MNRSIKKSHLTSTIIFHLYKRLQLNLDELEIELNTTYKFLARIMENIY